MRSHKYNLGPDSHICVSFGCFWCCHCSCPLTVLDISDSAGQISATNCSITSQHEDLQLSRFLKNGFLLLARVVATTICVTLVASMATRLDQISMPASLDDIFTSC